MEVAPSRDRAARGVELPSHRTVGAAAAAAARATGPDADSVAAGRPGNVAPRDPPSSRRGMYSVWRRHLLDHGEMPQVRSEPICLEIPSACGDQVLAIVYAAVS